MNHFHLTENNMVVFVCIVIGYFIGGSQLNHILIQKFSNGQILKQCC